jgi:predicted porin
MKLQKTQVAAAVGAALLLGATAVQAQAPASVSGGMSGINVQLYGQVSRSLMFVDDGFNSKWFNVDNQPSSTRFGINAAGQATPGLRVGGKIEVEMKSNPSNTVSFATPSVTNSFVERWLDAYFEGAWGRVSLGQGSGAADDVTTIDLSGTGMPNGNCPTDWGGGIQFRRADTGAVAGGTTGLGGTVTGQTGAFSLGGCNDFESRYDRVRYDSPSFGGFQARFSHGQLNASSAEATEAALWYTGKLAGDFQAAIGYSKANTTTDPTAAAAGADARETVGFGVSWLHTSGFNVTVQGSSVSGVSGVSPSVDDRTAKYSNLKLGWKNRQHAVALDYGMYKDQAQKGDDGTSIGLGYVWTPVTWTEIFAGYHIFSLDRDNLAFEVEDVKVLSIGTRIRF